MIFFIKPKQYTNVKTGDVSYLWNLVICLLVKNGCSWRLKVFHAVEIVSLAVLTVTSSVFMWTWVNWLGLGRLILPLWGWVTFLRAKWPTSHQTSSVGSLKETAYCQYTYKYLMWVYSGTVIHYQYHGAKSTENSNSNFILILDYARHL